MKCHRCGSVMVYERFYCPDENFSGWRYVFSAEKLLIRLSWRIARRRGEGKIEKKGENVNPDGTRWDGE